MLYNSKATVWLLNTASKQQGKHNDTTSLTEVGQLRIQNIGSFVVLLLEILPQVGHFVGHRRSDTGDVRLQHVDEYEGSTIAAQPALDLVLVVQFVQHRLAEVGRSRSDLVVLDELLQHHVNGRLLDPVLNPINSLIISNRAFEEQSDLIYIHTFLLPNSWHCECPGPWAGRQLRRWL